MTATHLRIPGGCLEAPQQFPRSDETICSRVLSERRQERVYDTHRTPWTVPSVSTNMAAARSSMSNIGSAKRAKEAHHDEARPVRGSGRGGDGGGPPGAIGVPPRGGGGGRRGRRE